MNRTFYIIIFFILLTSCNRQSSQLLEQALLLAGDNRDELETEDIFRFVPISRQTINALVVSFAQ
jgi:hypothetical protein